jgi:hypothetical protein
MPSRFVKARDNFCDFTIRERGVDTHPNHTVEVHNSWNESFGKRLMDELPRGSWMYDRTPTPRVFRILPAVMEQAVDLAMEFFGNVYVTEGDTVTNRVTGEVQGQPSLF